MIDKIVVGSGANRKEIPLVRNKSELRSVAGAIKGFLFPTKEAHQRAMDQGRANRATDTLANRMVPA